VSRYTADSRDRVRDAVDMLALVSARVELRRAGMDSYFGLCPFHDERSPSFHVRPDEKHYHCFGCQMSGDPFDFVMETEGLDFKGALEALADRFGVTLETEEEDPQAAARRERRERLFALLARAAVFYSRYLWDAREAGPAREYLLGRGVSEQTLREFRVGYAPTAWDRLLQASRQAGFGEEELLLTGLAQRSRERAERLFDRFRARVMFPAVDARGKVRGFGARAMSEEQRPKYLNTSDGELYHKREQLFGIDLARAPAAKAGRMILVEGYTDVLALHQAGIRNSVGIMGTSFTEEQLGALRRIVGVLELCLDADAAGQEAMVRAARLATGRGLELRVVELPEGADPGELIAQEGPEALRGRVAASVPFAVFQTRRILARGTIGSAEAKDRALEELRPVLATLPDGILRDELLREAAGRLELSEARLADLIGGPSPAPRPPSAGKRLEPGEPRRAQRGAADGVLDQQRRLERAFLALCVALPQDGERALAEIDAEHLITSGAYRRAARHLAGRVDSPLSGLPEGDDELAHVIADLVERAGRGSQVGASHVEHARLVLELAHLERLIRRARVERGIDSVALARERERVQQEIHAVVSRIEGTV
jgi:DNA primase